MSDYLETFSTAIETINDEELAWLLKMAQELQDAFEHEVEDEIPEELREVVENQGWEVEELYPALYSISMDIPGFWLRTDDTDGVKFAVVLMQAYLRKFHPSAYLYFSVAETCSSPRIGSFGGYAYFITSDDVRVMLLSHWLADEARQHERERSQRYKRERG